MPLSFRLFDAAIVVTMDWLFTLGVSNLTSSPALMPRARIRGASHYSRTHYDFELSAEVLEDGRGGRAGRQRSDRLGRRRGVRQWCSRCRSRSPRGERQQSTHAMHNRCPKGLRHDDGRFLYPRGRGRIDDGFAKPAARRRAVTTPRQQTGRPGTGRPADEQTWVWSGANSSSGMFHKKAFIFWSHGALPSMPLPLCRRRCAGAGHAPPRRTALARRKRHCERDEPRRHRGCSPAQTAKKCRLSDDAASGHRSLIEQVRVRPSIEPQRQAEGGAAAAQE